MIRKVTNMGYLTGPKSVSHEILKEHGTISTDLGIPVYDDKNDIAYYLFGDSFSLVPKENALQPGEGAVWRSNFAARAKKSDFKEGVRFDQVTCPMIEGDHYWPKCEIDRYLYDTTKIPTGGVVVDGKLYVFYFSITEWQGWKIRYNGLIRSDDFGETFSVVPSVHFIDERLLYDRFENKPKIEYLDSFSSPSFDYAVAPNFKQINVCRDKDDADLLYLFGIGNGRGTSARLMRVREKDIENLNEYEYFLGKDKNGNPIWEKGKEGGAKVIDNDDAIVLNGQVGELCVHYNDYLKKYVAIYLYHAPFAGQEKAIVMRVSQHVYGDYCEREVLLLGKEHTDSDMIYGGFTAPFMYEDGGKVFYLTVSQWAPIYNVLLLKAELK